MNWLHFVLLYLILNEINCIILVPINYQELKIPEANNGDNQEEHSNHEVTRAITQFHTSGEDDDDYIKISENFCDYEENRHKFIDFSNKTLIILITWNRTKVGEQAILPNICSVDNGLPLQRRCLSDNGWEYYNKSTVLRNCNISMFCPTEEFQHFIINNKGQLEMHQNIWKQAKIGELSNLRDLCLQPNGFHLTRKCLYDAKNYKAIWATVDHLKNFKCLQNTHQPIISNDLNILYDHLTTSSYLFRDILTRRHSATTLLTLLEKPKIKFLPGDVQITTEILKNIVSDSQDVVLSKHVFKIALNLMAVDPLVLRMSAKVNATNRLLEIFENFMDTLTENFVSNALCKVSKQPLNSNNSTININNITLPTEILNFRNIGVYAQIAKNLSVFFVNPDCANISGIAIYNFYQHQYQQQYSTQKIHYDSYNDFYYRFIFMNESVNELLHEHNVEVASFIPTRLWTSLKSIYIPPARTPKIVFKVYAHDSLFVEEGFFRLRKPSSKILSISVPTFKEKLPENLPFILRNKSPLYNIRPNSNNGCGYWNYSTWVSSGVSTDLFSSKTENDLIFCSTDHLTQFSYLLGGSFRQDDLSDEVMITAAHQQVLDIISITGCSLSLLGLLGIWITALIFKSWRSQTSNKILLNMCISLNLQMVLFLFVNTDDVSEILVQQRNYTKCVILGALLQYSILVLFSWMLIVAFLQFQRYVTVIGIQRPKHYILKSAVVAWSLPLIPTILVVFLDWKSYIPSNYQLVNNTGICYPSGNGLYFGVILPVFLIIAANFSIFVYVFYSISRTLSMSMHRNEKRMVTKQIRLSILLFFLLGLSWIFGLLAFMKAGIIFSYLFCLTATLQGFVLFIYFVVLDQNARDAWQNLLCPTWTKKLGDKKSIELRSITTTTTSFTQKMSSSRDH